jgi:hypothetical protein
MAQTMQAFIANMLNMREQNAKAAQFRAEQDAYEAQQLQKAIAGVSQNIGSSIQKYGQQQQQNQMANALMGEYFGGGGTAGTEVLSFGGAKALGAGGTLAAPGRTFTGGMDELNARMELAKIQSQAGNAEIRNALSAARYDLSAQGLANQEERTRISQQNADLAKDVEARKTEQANVAADIEAYKQAGPKYQEQVKAINAYNTSLVVAQDALSHVGPDDRQAYERATQLPLARHAVVTKMGLDVPAPQFPSWEQFSAIRNQQQAVETARAAKPGGGFFGLGGSTAEQLKEKLGAQEETLRELPGYSLSQQGMAPYMAPAPAMPDFTSFMQQREAQRAAGTAPGAGGGGGGATGTISLQEARRKYPDARPGQPIYLRDGTKLIITE